MTNPLRDPRWLLEKLEDPFSMFPVEDVFESLIGAVDQAENRHSELGGPYGVSRKYWSVEQEHHHETIGLLFGTMFVLGQAAITQSISILNELRKHPQTQSIIPQDKTNKLIAYAAIEPTTNLSKIVIINAVSNYFKHVFEWPENWNPIPTKGSQAETIRIVHQLGMRPGAITDNVLRAADVLALSCSNPRALAEYIQEWREAWVRALSPCF